MNVSPGAAAKISVSWTSGANPMSYVRNAVAGVAGIPGALLGMEDLRSHTWEGHSSRPMTVHRLDVAGDAVTSSTFHANSLLKDPEPSTAPIGDARGGVDALRAAIDRLGAPSATGPAFQGSDHTLGYIRKNGGESAIDGAERDTVAVAVTDASGTINRWTVPADAGADVRAAAEALAALA